MIRASRNWLKRSVFGSHVVTALVGSAGLRIAGMGLGFLVGVQLARGLGADGYGVYGLAMSIIALLTVPVEFGLPQLVTREVAVAHVERDWGRLAGVLRWATRTSFLVALLVAGGVLTAVVLSGGGVFTSELGLTLLAGLVMVPLVAQGNINGAALRGLQRIVRGQLPEVLLCPLLFAVLLFLVPVFLAPLNPTSAMVLGAISAALTLVVAVCLLRRAVHSKLAGTTPELNVRYWWSSTIPMALTEGMRVLQGHFIILLLGIMCTDALVGIFRVASSVSLIIAVPVTLFNVVNAPLIARLYGQGDYQRLQRLLAWTAVAMTVCVLLLMVPASVVGGPLLGTVFGSEFSQGDTALFLLCFGVLANSLFGSNATLLNMTGHHKRVTRASAISLLVLALLSPVLISLTGIEGAAVASATTSLLWNLLMWRDARRLLRIDSGIAAFFWSGGGR